MAFSPCLKNGFVNWDDPYHLLENEAVRGLDLGHLKAMATSPVQGMYIPLTLFSFAVEYHFFGYDPFVYHLDNVLLYLLTVALVYFLFLRMGLTLRAAFWGALVFGVHPMHVESVAWVTERKDVLAGVFYLSAVLSYLRYSRDRQGPAYILSLFLSFLAILAKPMAFSLPLVLCIYDWFWRRRMDKTVFWDKLPFFFLVVPVAAVTFIPGAQIRPVAPGELVCAWAWSFMQPLRKFVFPDTLVPYYPAPQFGAVLNWDNIASLVMAAAVLFLIFRWRKDRQVVFAFLFYFATNLFLLFVTRIGEARVADRWMFLPSLGFCLLFGVFCDRLIRRASPRGAFARGVVYLAAAVIILALGLKTFVQCPVWKDSYTLWTRIIDHSPPVATAYNNRGNVQPDPEAARTDYSRAIAIDPEFWEAYFNRARVYCQLGKYESALPDLNQFLKANPRDAEAYFIRGKIYLAKKSSALALTDFDKALELVPGACQALSERSLAYDALGETRRAAEDRKKAKGWGALFFSVAHPPGE